MLDNVRVPSCTIDSVPILRLSVREPRWIENSRRYVRVTTRKHCANLMLRVPARVHSRIVTSRNMFGFTTYCYICLFYLKPYQELSTNDQCNWHKITNLSWRTNMGLLY